MHLHELEADIGLTIKDYTVFEQAFTHTSYAHERKKKETVLDNERLEFLGDAVLEIMVSIYLYHRFMEMDEGNLTRMRARIVCESSLAAFAKQLGLGKYVRLGKGEELTGGRERSSLLADVFEAFVGALFLDQGFSVTQTFIYEKVLIYVQEDWLSQSMDAKSQLQELVQQNKMGSLEYLIVDTSGPAHDRHFKAEVHLKEKVVGTGTGRSKKEAEQDAAADALEALKNNTLDE